MLTTTVLALKKPDAASGDQRSDLYNAVRDNADIIESKVGKATIIATEEAASTTSYALLTTPDQVTGLVVPAKSYLEIVYSARWGHKDADIDWTASTDPKAAIFIGTNQLQALAYNSGTPSVAAAEATLDVAVGNAGLTGDAFWPLSSAPHGLASGLEGGAGGTIALPTTGLALAHNPNIGAGNETAPPLQTGACRIQVPAGTYDISVRFKLSAGTGSLKVKDRFLYARVVQHG